MQEMTLRKGPAMIDRMWMWEVSQDRRRDLLESAGVCKRRRGLQEGQDGAKAANAVIRGLVSLVRSGIRHDGTPGGARASEDSPGSSLASNVKRTLVFPFRM